MPDAKAAPALKAGKMTVILAAGLVVIKGIAFILSGSLAVLSSLIDSLMDVMVSALNYGAILYSAKPADHEHRYGHGKIEGLAALLQAALTGGAALFLVFESFLRLLNPQPIEAHITAIAIMMVSAMVAFVITAVQNFALKKTASLAVESDHAHYSSDIILNGGVILTVLVDYFQGPGWIDAAFALAVALWLGCLAKKIAGKGLDMILDRELPEGQRHKVLDIIRAHEKVLGVHDLRTTRSGMTEIIAFDIEADPSLSLHDAHAITKDLEAEILKLFPDAEIMIHVDPHGETDDSRHKISGVHH